MEGQAVARPIGFGGHSGRPSKPSGSKPDHSASDWPPQAVGHPADYVVIDMPADDAADSPRAPDAQARPGRGPSLRNLLKLAGVLLLGLGGILSGATFLPGASAVSHHGEPIVPAVPNALPGLPALPLPALGPVPVSHPFVLPYPEPALASGWPDQVELMASSSQNHYSYFSQNGSDYTNGLMDLVRRHETHSLGQGQAILWEQGYPISGGWQRPVSSANVAGSQCLVAWDKRDMEKQRFALLLDGGKEFQQDCHRWRDMLKEEFQVPSHHMIYYPRANTTDVAQGLRTIARTIRENRLNPNDVEVMIYYSGHGKAFQDGDTMPQRDGDALGTIALMDGRYGEQALRQALDTHLPDIPTTVILDACQSGAWIA
jgi:hypothetical protein